MTFCTISDALASEETAAFIVCDLSDADIPVVTPLAASIEFVNLVLSTHYYHQEPLIVDLIV